MVNAVAVLHAILVLTNILGAIDPGFLTLALLHVVNPLALVATTIHVLVHAKATSLVRSELTDVDVALSVPESALALCLIFEPVALVDGAVHPLLDAIAASFLGARRFVDQHLAFVHTTIWEDVIVHEDQACNIIPKLRLQVLVTLFESITLIYLTMHHARTLVLLVVHARLVFLVKLWVIAIHILLIVLILLHFGPVAVDLTFAVLSFHFVSFEWL